MARTKAKARRGPEGHLYRQNAKTPEGRKKNQENKKRPRDEVRDEALTALDQSGSSQPPPAKKSKKNRKKDKSKQVDESAQLEGTAPPQLSTEHDASTNTSNSPVLTELEKTHNVTTMSIVSSSHIQQKVTRALEILSEYPTIAPAKPKVVMLHAKAPVASKLITIAEIVKREIAKDGGKWYQYNRLGQVMEEKKREEHVGKRKKKVGGADEEMADHEDGGEGQESEEEFETMKTPFERAIEGKPKVGAVPVMTIYLSRVRVDSLKKDYR